MADPTQPARPPILDLDTLTARQIVRIDRVDYEMRAPDELSVLDYHRLVVMGKRLDVLEQIAEPTDEDTQEFDRLLDTICRTVLLAPDAVRQRLGFSQRVAVALTFTKLRLAPRFPPVGVGTAAATSTGPGDPMPDPTPETIGAT